MKKYEYKFVEIQRKNGLKVKTGETFEECKQVIMEEAEQGGLKFVPFLICGISMTGKSIAQILDKKKSETIKSFGLWIIIPIMMTAVDMFQIMKCLKNKG